MKGLHWDEVCRDSFVQCFAMYFSSVDLVMWEPECLRLTRRTCI